MSKGAPKGNQFWKLRSKHGRDKLFETPQLMWKAACEYFEWVDANPFMEVEQKKGSTSIKIGKDTDIDGLEKILSGNQDTISLPKMRPYTMQGLCRYLNCNTDFFNAFKKRQQDKEDQLSKDFCEIVTRIEETIYEQKFSGAAAGFLNPNIIARDLGLADKKEVQASGEIEVTLEI